MENLIELNADNLAQEHICCAISDKKCKDSYEQKKAWLKKEFNNGYIFRRIDERAKVFIEISFFSACRQNTQEKRAERLVEKALGGEADVDFEKEKIVIETEEGKFTTGEAKSWPDDMPNDVPKFKYGKIINVSTQEYDDGKSWTVMKALAQEAGLDEKIILHLARLTDLSRIKWVNHTFANVLLLAGFETAEKVAEVDYLELFESVKKVNEEKKLYPAHIGPADMKRCIEGAQALTFEVEY